MRAGLILVRFIVRILISLLSTPSHLFWRQQTLGNLSTLALQRNTPTGVFWIGWTFFCLIRRLLAAAWDMANFGS
jgi:hypothetical protein